MSKNDWPPDITFPAPGSADLAALRGAGHGLLELGIREVGTDPPAAFAR
jgi:hypothetical protein